MVVARASGTLIASSLKQNTFLTFEVRPRGGSPPYERSPKGRVGEGGHPPYKRSPKGRVGEGGVTPPTNGHPRVGWARGGHPPYKRSPSAPRTDDVGSRGGDGGGSAWWVTVPGGTPPYKTRLRVGVITDPKWIRESIP